MTNYRNYQYAWLVCGLILSEAVGNTFTMNSTSNSTNNGSSEDMPQEPDPAILEGLNITNHVIVGLAFLICIVAIFGNSCVIYLVVSKRRMRNVTNYFIASLAVSDIMIAVICIPFSFTANVLFSYWPYGSGLCPILHYFQTAVVFQNAYTLLAMSAERYIAIVHPFLQRLGKTRCLQIVFICWILAFITPLPTAVTSKMNYEQDGVNETGYYLCYEVWEHDSQRFAYSVTILVLQFFLPVAVLVFTYARIVHVIWLKDMPAPGAFMNQNKDAKEVVKVKEADPRKKELLPKEDPFLITAFDELETGFQSTVRLQFDVAAQVDAWKEKLQQETMTTFRRSRLRTGPRGQKVIKMMITVVGLYILCWLPLHLFTIAMDIDSDLQYWPYTQLAWTSFTLLALSTCVYNPFIYWWMNPKFEEGYKMLYKQLKARITCQPLEDDFLDFGTSVATSKRFVSTGYTSTMDFNDRRPSSSTQVEYGGLDGTAMEKLIPKDQPHQNGDLKPPPLSDITETQEDGGMMVSRQ